MKVCWRGSTGSGRRGRGGPGFDSPWIVKLPDLVKIFVEREGLVASFLVAVALTTVRLLMKVLGESVHNYNLVCSVMKASTDDSDRLNHRAHGPGLKDTIL